MFTWPLGLLYFYGGTLLCVLGQKNKFQNY